MLDENPTFSIIEPTIEKPNTIWFNIFVPDIKETYQKALSLGCAEIQSVTEFYLTMVCQMQFSSILLATNGCCTKCIKK